jgi:hypothetical protein
MTPTYRNRDEDEPRRYEAPSRSDDDDDPGLFQQLAEREFVIEDDDDRGSPAIFVEQ